MRQAVSFASVDYELKKIGGGDAFGRALREDENLKTPIIVFCDGILNGKKRAGHWVTVVRRTSGDKFCVLDSASGRAHSIPINARGSGIFNFQATDANPGAEKGQWVVVLKEGYKLVRK
jgi:hypothetical protein